MKYLVEVMAYPRSEGGGWTAKLFNEGGACVDRAWHSSTKDGAIRQAVDIAKARKDFESYRVQLVEYQPNYY